MLFLVGSCFLNRSGDFRFKWILPCAKDSIQPVSECSLKCSEWNTKYFVSDSHTFLAKHEILYILVLLVPTCHTSSSHQCRSSLLLGVKRVFPPLGWSEGKRRLLWLLPRKLHTPAVLKPTSLRSDCPLNPSCHFSNAFSAQAGIICH